MGLLKFVRENNKYITNFLIQSNSYTQKELSEQDEFGDIIAWAIHHKDIQLMIILMKIDCLCLRKPIYTSIHNLTPEQKSWNEIALLGQGRYYEYHPSSLTVVNNQLNFQHPLFPNQISVDDIKLLTQRNVKHNCLLEYICENGRPENLDNLDLTPYINMEMPNGMIPIDCAIANDNNSMIEYFSKLFNKKQTELIANELGNQTNCDTPYVSIIMEYLN